MACGLRVSLASAACSRFCERFRSDRLVGLDHIHPCARFAQLARDHVARDLGAHQQHALSFHSFVQRRDHRLRDVFLRRDRLRANRAVSIAFLVAGPMAAIFRCARLTATSLASCHALEHRFHAVHAGQDQPVVSPQDSAAPCREAGRSCGLRISMNGISMTSHPSSRSAEDSAPACFFARETSTRQPARGRSVAVVLELFAKVGVLRLRRAKSALPPLRMTLID